MRRNYSWSAKEITRETRDEAKSRSFIDNYGIGTPNGITTQQRSYAAVSMWSRCCSALATTEDQGFSEQRTNDASKFLRQKACPRTLRTSMGWTNIHAEMPLAPAMPKLAAVGIPLDGPVVDLEAMSPRELEREEGWGTPNPATAHKEMDVKVDRRRSGSGEGDPTYIMVLVPAGQVTFISLCEDPCRRSACFAWVLHFLRHDVQPLMSLCRRYFGVPRSSNRPEALGFRYGSAQTARDLTSDRIPPREVAPRFAYSKGACDPGKGRPAVRGWSRS